MTTILTLLLCVFVPAGRSAFAAGAPPGKILITPASFREREVGFFSRA